MRRTISIDGTVLDMTTLMAEGNPGGLSVLIEILKVDPDLGPFTIMSLDDMNMRGGQIWVGYKDYCGSDITKFMDAVKGRDPKMVKMVNEQCSYAGEIAVTGGGSWRGNL